MLPFKMHKETLYCLQCIDVSLIYNKISYPTVHDKRSLQSTFRKRRQTEYKNSNKHDKMLFLCDRKFQNTVIECMLFYLQSVLILDGCFIIK